MAQRDPGQWAPHLPPPSSRPLHSPPPHIKPTQPPPLLPRSQKARTEQQNSRHNQASRPGTPSPLPPQQEQNKHRRICACKTPGVEARSSAARRSIAKHSMGRSPCCEQAHTNKGAWTKEEDQRLIAYIKAHGEGCWRSLPKAAGTLTATCFFVTRASAADGCAGLLRCGKSCRLRWINYLRPDLKRGNFTEEEDELIIKFHELFGNKWSLIAGRLPGRTDNEIKNYWNTHIKRKLLARGVDPQTHRPVNAAAAAPAQPQPHYQLPAVQKQSFPAPPPGHHQLPQDNHFARFLPHSPEACSHSSDDEPRSATPPPPATRPRQHLDIDLNLSISLAPYQPPEESGDKPLKQVLLPASTTTTTAAAADNFNTVPVCLCLNSLGYRPGVECVCGGGGGSRQQEQWARTSLLQAAPSFPLDVSGGVLGPCELVCRRHSVYFEYG